MMRKNVVVLCRLRICQQVACVRGVTLLKNCMAEIPCTLANRLGELRICVVWGHLGGGSSRAEGREPCAQVTARGGRWGVPRGQEGEKANDAPKGSQEGTDEILES